MVPGPVISNNSQPVLPASRSSNACDPALSPESSCENKRADLVFIIDSSRSVNTHDYAKVKEFIMDILQFLDIGPDVTRVGLLQYGSTVKNEFSLKTFKRKSEVERAVKRMRHLSTGTMTGLAIQYALNIAFSEAEGARPLRENVPRVIMIVTDGRPQDSVAEVAAKARDTGILIFAIGVGQVDLNTLKAIGSEPHEDHVFLVANFSQMESLTSVFQNKLCSKSCPRGPPVGTFRVSLFVFQVQSVLPHPRDCAGKGFSKGQGGHGDFWAPKGLGFDFWSRVVPGLPVCSQPPVMWEAAN